MTAYLFMLYEPEEDWADATKSEWDTAMGQHDAFGNYVREHGGNVLGGEALHGVATATSVRGDLVTDGPWVELKEQFGGYYVIDAPDLDTAIDFAKHCPVGRGGVEIRPVMDTGVQQESAPS